MSLHAPRLCSTDALGSARARGVVGCDDVLAERRDRLEFAKTVERGAAGKPGLPYGDRRPELLARRVLGSPALPLRCGERGRTRHKNRIANSSPAKRCLNVS